ncbi:MAG: general secretion pathway protein J [Gammaproteobacteria bacterium]
MNLARKYRGFTLLEIMVAVAIFSFIAVLAMPALTDLMKKRDAISKSNQQISALQFAISYLERDWSQVSTRNIRDRYGSNENNIVIEDNSVKFTRSGHSNLLSVMRSNLQRVEYLVEDNNLVRKHWRSLDQGVGEEPVVQILLEQINQFEVGLKTADEKLIDTWPNELSERTGAPIAFSFVINLRGLGEIERILEIPNGVL